MKSNVSAREFSGKEVIGTRGWRIGRVRDVVLDMKTWEVEALDVVLSARVAREFGLKQTLRSTRIPIRVANIQGMGDAAITLRITKGQLRTLLVPSRARGKGGPPKAEPSAPSAGASEG